MEESGGTASPGSTLSEGHHKDSTTPAQGTSECQGSRVKGHHWRRQAEVWTIICVNKSAYQKELNEVTTQREIILLI